MKFRAQLIMPMLALACVATAPLAAADSNQRRPALEATLVERFRFHAGASLLAPAGVGADGSICVGTADGYVHLLRPDGSFRWSHSVRGAVMRRPVLSGSRWFVATSAERIYALTADGTLDWVFRPPSPISSELAVDATGISYFIASDRFMYGVTAHGAVSLRATFGDLRAGPITGPDGAVWAQNQIGTLLRARGQDVRRMTPDPIAALDFGAPDGLRDPEGHEWHVRDDGVLEFRRTTSSRFSSLSLTSSALLSPSWSAFGHYALISARDGLVVALTVASDRQGS